MRVKFFAVAFKKNAKIVAQINIHSGAPFQRPKIKHKTVANV